MQSSFKFSILEQMDMTPVVDVILKTMKDNSTEDLRKLDGVHIVSTRLRFKSEFKIPQDVVLELWSVHSRLLFLLFVAGFLGEIGWQNKIVISISLNIRFRWLRKRTQKQNESSLAKCQWFVDCLSKSRKVFWYFQLLMRSDGSEGYLFLVIMLKNFWLNRQRMVPFKMTTSC